MQQELIYSQSSLRVLSGESCSDFAHLAFSRWRWDSALSCHQIQGTLLIFTLAQSRVDPEMEVLAVLLDGVLGRHEASSSLLCKYSFSKSRTNGVSTRIHLQHLTSSCQIKFLEREALCDKYLSSNWQVCVTTSERTQNTRTTTTIRRDAKDDWARPSLSSVSNQWRRPTQISSISM